MSVSSGHKAMVSLLRAHVWSRLAIRSPSRSWTCANCAQKLIPRVQRRAYASNPADQPGFVSLIDTPPQLIRTGKRHGWGLLILAAMPITAFGLGTWQVQRLGWKTELLARFEDRLVRPPLPLPFKIDLDSIKDFDYRRIQATGRYRHDQEMLIGPRMHDGNDGYLVVTPLERTGPDGQTGRVLVCRGWITKDKKAQSSRPESINPGRVQVQGLLREPWKKNMFTPSNVPEKGEFYFPDVIQMAGLTDSQPVWIEETMKPDLLQAYDRQAKGMPIGRPGEVNLRNNHTQYIFTWYSLSLATAIMFWMVVKKPSTSIARRVRQSKEW